jgi:hypothetical protein
LYISGIKLRDMPQFRFETEVQTTVTLEYFIDADSLEEALEQLRSGEMRVYSNIVGDEIDWGTEVITVEEEID